MRASLIWLLGIVVVAAFWTLAAEQGASAPPLSKLKVDRSAPLLLDDAPQSAPAPKTGADNEACFCCHTNYREEQFAGYHAKGDIGCVDCHGQSHAHRNDEQNTTPPEVMYPTEAIEACCQKCHDTHDAPAAKVIATWQERCPGKTDPAELLCTDCHGDHRLKLRIVQWDKKTGKLLEEDALQPTLPSSAAVNGTSGDSDSGEMQ